MHRSSLYYQYNKLKKLKKAQHGLIMRMCHESRVRINLILNFDSENKKCPQQAGTGLFMGWESCPRALKSDSPAATAELGVKTDDRKGTTAPRSSVPCRRQDCPEQKPHFSSPTAPITRTKRTLNFPLGFSKRDQKKKKNVHFQFPANFRGMPQVEPVTAR